MGLEARAPLHQGLNRNWAAGWPALLFTAGLAVAVGGLFSRLGLPVPWLLGPLATTAVLRLTTGHPRRLPGWWLVLGQATLGLGIGLQSRPETILHLGSGLWALAVLVAVTAGASFLGGWAMTRWAGLDPASAFLGSIPGAAVGIVGMSGDLGADPRVVAALQYLRVVIVTVVAPLLVGRLSQGGQLHGITSYPAFGEVVPPAAALVAGSNLAAPATSLVGGGTLLAYGLLIAGVVAALWAAQRVHLPAPNFLGPLLLGLAIRGLALPVQPLPVPLQTGAMVVIGLSVGMRFDRETLTLLGRAAAVGLAVILGLLGVAAGAGWAFHRVTGVDLATAWMGAVPGGMDVLTAAAPAVGANPALVAAMHLMRFLAAAFAGPILARRLMPQAAGGRD